MEPENGPLEKEIPIGNHHFQGSMLIFGGVSKISLKFLVNKGVYDFLWTVWQQSCRSRVSETVHSLSDPFLLQHPG